MKEKKLTRRDFLKIFSGDAVKASLGAEPNELSLTKLITVFDIEVDEELCTLCGACARVCSKNALLTYRDGDEIFLLFDGNNCDGCRDCLDVCPENALKLREVEKKEEEKIEPVVKASSKIAYCKSCGKILGPEKSIERVAARLKEKGLETPLETLYLCPECKARLNY